MTLLPRQSAPEPAPVIIDEEEEYEVESIVNHRKFRNKLQYLVKWKGYGDDQNQWLPVEELDHAPRLLAIYRRESGLSFGTWGRQS